KIQVPGDQRRVHGQRLAIWFASGSENVRPLTEWRSRWQLERCWLTMPARHCDLLAMGRACFRRRVNGRCSHETMSPSAGLLESFGSAYEYRPGAHRDCGFIAEVPYRAIYLCREVLRVAS